MILIAFATFLAFGLICKAGLTYWRFLIFSLVCQLVATNMPENLANQPLVSWSVGWLLPLGFALAGAIIDRSLTILARTIFVVLSVFAFLLGLWVEFQANHSTKPIVAPVPEESPTTIYGPEPEKISLAWEILESKEGCFRVLSPVPASTVATFHEVDNHQLKVTTTRIQDIDPNLCYIIVTTHYPKDFLLPEASQQATLAVQHLMKTYGFDSVVEMKAIIHAGYNGLGFHANNSQTNEQMMGLIIPTESILYQVLVLASRPAIGEESASKFLMSFEPCNSKNERQLDHNAQRRHTSQ